MSRPTIVSIIGSRARDHPGRAALAALAHCVEEILVHTGQHYDPAMSDLQIADLRLPLPEYNLGSARCRPRRAASSSPASGSPE